MHEAEKVLNAEQKNDNTMKNQALLEAREQIQEDLICLLESRFDSDFLRQRGLACSFQAMKDQACQIVVDNFAKLLED